MGIRVGFGLNEATMDSNGRIVIPEEVRKELGLNEGSKIRVRLEKSGISGGSAVIFDEEHRTGRVHQTYGRYAEEGESRQTRRPLRLKEIWGGT
jgi:AbrB family looped-hinge helix DNA binding protein